jgi:hypothetical protein
MGFRTTRKKKPPRVDGGCTGIELMPEASYISKHPNALTELSPAFFPG